MPLPLDGIRVVDFSRVLAGPHCAKTLLDLGAEVIKLEPPGGDLSRRAFPNRGGISGYYSQQNAGKRNVSVDLNVPGARDVAVRLCDTGDVIVEKIRRQIPTRLPTPTLALPGSPSARVRASPWSSDRGIGRQVLRHLPPRRA